MKKKKTTNASFLQGVPKWMVYTVAGLVIIAGIVLASAVLLGFEFGTNSQDLKVSVRPIAGDNIQITNERFQKLTNVRVFVDRIECRQVQSELKSQKSLIVDLKTQCWFFYRGIDTVQEIQIDANVGKKVRSSTFYWNQ